MRVLLVDDEVRVLEGLERMLLQIVDDDWEIVTSESGASALEVLETSSCDVVVSDMRMPAMDGAELLRRVHERHPDVVRIVLSGHMDEEAAIRAMPHTHQFLSKPCSGDELHQVIARTQELRRLLSPTEMRRAIGSLDRLPSVPKVYAELERALASDRTAAPDIAAIVSRDPALAAKLMQLVNSAYFRRGGTIGSVERAVAVLGLKLLQALVLSVATFEASAHARFPRGWDIELVQRRSFRAATIAQALAPSLAERASVVGRSRPPGVPGNDAFLAALLADVGLLALATAAPDALAEAAAMAEARGLPLHAVEREVYGTTHAHVGGYLLGVWGLPFPIIEAVSSHHDTLCPAAAVPLLVATTHIGEHLSDDLPIDEAWATCFPGLDFAALARAA